MRSTMLLIMMLALMGATCGYGAQGRIRLLDISGPINPATAEYVGKNLREASRGNELLVMIRMDTPGGLDNSMRSIVKDILSSPVPVAVLVAPTGARAASAGAIIAISADFCAMAPGTSIGAAHPVVMGQQPDKVMGEKILNDTLSFVAGIAAYRGRNGEAIARMVSSSESLTDRKALESNVIDLIARDGSELLARLDGRGYRRGETVRKLEISGAVVARHDMDAREKILNVIGDPNIAYLLMMLGLLGLFFELSTPGAILPGVVGGIALLLAFFAFQTLPINYTGVLLILLAMILFIAEIKVTSHGMLTVGGVIALALGSLLLIDTEKTMLRINWGLIVTTTLTVTALAFIVVRKSVLVHRKKPASGKEGFPGEVGTADTDIHENGRAFVRGEYWNAWSEDWIASGEKIEVVAVERMRIKVKRTA